MQPPAQPTVDQQAARIALAALRGPEALDAVLSAVGVPTVAGPAVRLRRIDLRNIAGFGPRCNLELDAHPGLTVLTVPDPTLRDRLTQLIESGLTGAAYAGEQSTAQVVLDLAASTGRVEIRTDWPDPDNPEPRRTIHAPGLPTAGERGERPAWLRPDRRVVVTAPEIDVAGVPEAVPGDLLTTRIEQIDRVLATEQDLREEVRSALLGLGDKGAAAASLLPGDYEHTVDFGTMTDLVADHYERVEMLQAILRLRVPDAHEAGRLADLLETAPTHRLVAEAWAYIGAPPALLAQRTVRLQRQSAALAAWHEWTMVSDDPAELAAHLRTQPALAEATWLWQDEAEDTLAVEEVWTQVEYWASAYRAGRRGLRLRQLLCRAGELLDSLQRFSVRNAAVLMIDLVIARAVVEAPGFLVLELPPPIPGAGPAKAEISQMLSRLLQLAQREQVIVLTSGDDLAAAVRRRDARAQLLLVAADEHRRVLPQPWTDPAQRAIDRAWAVTDDPALDPGVKSEELAALLRQALERAAEERFLAGNGIRSEWEQSGDLGSRLELALGVSDLSDWALASADRRQALDLIGCEVVEPRAHRGAILAVSRTVDHIRTGAPA
ncbi:hypothetical protein [Granulicoccus phenolivorans]|uniref:hypothetical protein n=1 Tax=Granulicoccus phenolivorans TaxID=266854 RepID=UPI00040D7FD7|nr:hypothetical protein [Granulicoccus phenolivorans]